MNSYVKHFRDLEVYRRMLVGFQISSFRNETRHAPSGGARRSCPTNNECLRRVGQLRPRNADGETRTLITDLRPLTTDH
jgi:hypothetical protein